MKVRKEFLWRTLMKITDLQLEDYGIYKKVSIKPPQNQLVVVMGQNESGKTTLLHFIRDMLLMLPMKNIQRNCRSCGGMV